MELHLSSRRAPRFGLVAALLALGVMVLGMAPALADSGPAPIKYDVSGTVKSTGSTTFDLAGTGMSSTLGRVGYAGKVQITNVDSNGVITDVLTETLTASNGDTLTLNCQETATPVRPGVLHGIDKWTVTSGTGRFAHATGSGTGTTDANLNVGTFSKSASGTINLN